LAQASVAVPVGKNIHDRPDEAGDVVLEINSAGTYTLNGRSVVAAQLVGQLATLMSRTRDHVVYIRADARLPSSAIDSMMAMAVRGDVCVASCSTPWTWRAARPAWKSWRRRPGWLSAKRCRGSISHDASPRETTRLQNALTATLAGVVEATHTSDSRESW